MGCDIHMMAEVKKDGKWRKVGKVFKNNYFDPKAKKGEWGSNEFTDEPWDGRSYNLFAILANVRNGRGFAGIKTGEGFNPISKPKGVPSDASKQYKKDVEDWDGDGHSHSYFTVSELLAYDWDQKTTHYGVVEVDQYRVFLEKGKPDHWSGDVWGNMVKIISNDQMGVLAEIGFDKFWDKLLKKDKNHSFWEVMPHFYTQVSWTESYKDSCYKFVTETIPALQKLGDPENVRIVFFFDN